MNPLLISAASKIIVKVIITIVVVVFGIVYFKKFFKKREGEKALEELDKTININKLSFPLSYYGIWAKDLYTAMNGFGTNEQSVYDIFKKLNSKDDILKLITAFGVKEDETLTEWIIDDLGDDERETLNQILTDKNIDYQF